MVEYTLSLDSIFSSLADPTRRDILRRLREAELSVGELAMPYPLTFAAVSKHLKVLESAQMIIKRRRGKKQMVSLSPQAFANAAEYIEWYRSQWENRLNSLDNYLINEEE